MLKKIQRATASSPEGTRGLVRGVLACAAQNIAFMLPTSLLYALVRDPIFCFPCLVDNSWDS